MEVYLLGMADSGFGESSVSVGDESFDPMSVTSLFVESRDIERSITVAAKRLSELLNLDVYVQIEAASQKVESLVRSTSDEPLEFDLADKLASITKRAYSGAITQGETDGASQGSWLTISLARGGNFYGHVTLRDEKERMWEDREIGFARILADAITEAINSGNDRKDDHTSSMLETIFELAPDAYYLNDLSGTFIDGNQAAERLVGYNRDELIGQNLLKLKLITPGQLPRAAASLLKSALGRPTGPEKFDIVRKDGSAVAVEVRSHPVKVGGRTLVLAIARDITDRTGMEAELRLAKDELEKRVDERTRDLQNAVKRLESTKTELQRSATHDPLTLLPNRFLLTDRLSRLIASSGRNATKHAVLAFDVDGFAGINSRHGQRVGDELLKEIANRAEKTFRPEDIICRLSGDVFAAVIEGVDDERNAAIAAARLLVALSKPYKLDRKEVSINCRVGITLSGEHSDPNAMLQNAESALKQAKKKGNARYELYDKGMKAAAEERLRLEADLKSAVERDEFVLYFQPIVDMNSRRLAGFEALTRWQHGDRLEQPGSFVPLAEQSGIIVPLGSWLIKAVCNQVAEWNDRYDHIVDMISLNLSGKDFGKTADVVGRLDLAISETRLHPSQIRVEVTEGSLIDDVENAIASLEAIRELGVKIELDDFGTGYSSLSYLHRFPIDTLKIDRSFIMRFPDTSSERLVGAIVRMASDLGIEVIAEGVETEQHVDALLDMGCTLGQGYLFSRPVEVEAASHYIAREAGTASNEPTWSSKPG